MNKKETILLAYVPVLHSGYLKLFKDNPNKLYLIGDSLVRELAKDIGYFGRDIRALDTITMRKMIESLGIFKEIKEATVGMLTSFHGQIVAPDEDITREVVRRFLPDIPVSFVPVFLRWDRRITQQEYEVNPSHSVSNDPKDIQLIQLAKETADRSSDWWRQIGALAVKDGRVLYVEHNRHLPSPHSPYALGDPRNNFEASEAKNYYSSIHAEAAIIASAARDGQSLKDSSIYVTTFPCATCARLLREIGAKKVYYAHGFSSLDGEEILKRAGVELIYVPTPPPS